MNYLKKITLILILLVFSSQVYAETKVVFFDMKYILNNSKAGKAAQEFLQKSYDKNQKKFLNLEQNLKDEEKKLLEQKNVLSNEDYQAKTDSLRKKVIDYQSQRRSSLDKIAKQRIEAKDQLIKKLNPMISNYMKENEISIIIDKKNVILGNAELDITNLIIEKLNTELPSLNLK
ncbi:MAG TPA: OmpH family outer membrane protein [Candidatus Pelagibacter sp.]|jgi:Skp family chaperone for outer membrane proteins|nr:OmpH family outer membrane protein [Candidatus Pelagibacter sp.]